jgi:hypothetical protein
MSLHIDRLRRSYARQRQRELSAARFASPIEELEAWRYAFYRGLGVTRPASGGLISESYWKLSAEARALLSDDELVLLWNRVAPTDPWERLRFLAGLWGDLPKVLARIGSERLALPTGAALAALWGDAPGRSETGGRDSFHILGALSHADLQAIGIPRIVQRWQKGARKAASSAFEYLSHLPEAVLAEIPAEAVMEAFLARARKGTGQGALELLQHVPASLGERLDAAAIAEVWDRCAKRSNPPQYDRVLEVLKEIPARAAALVDAAAAEAMWRHIAGEKPHAAAKVLSELPDAVAGRFSTDALLPLLDASDAALRLWAIRESTRMLGPAAPESGPREAGQRTPRP